MITVTTSREENISSNTMEYGGMSLDKKFPTLQRIVVLPSTGSSLHRMTLKMGTPRTLEVGNCLPKEAGSHPGIFVNSAAPL
jgi:hypothetical protein